MATQSFEQLIAGANKIKTNELPESNTASLVGEQLIQMVNKQSEEHSERTAAISREQSDRAAAIKAEQDARIKGTTEYNVSVHHPTEGIGGTNKYTLEMAIQKIPAELRTVGIKCSFLTEDNSVQTYVYQGGTFTSADSWAQGFGGAGGSGAFDISAYNKGVAYDNLSTALSAIPPKMQKGGMSIMFINTSTNMYEYWRLKTKDWSINTSDWQSSNYIVYDSPQNLDEESKSIARSNLGLSYASPWNEKQILSQLFKRCVFTGKANDLIYKLSNDDSYKKCEYDAEIPSIIVNGYNVEITTNDTMCDIYYTTDGSDPSKHNGVIYSQSFEMDADCTIKAISINEYGVASIINSYEYQAKDSDVIVFKDSLLARMAVTPVSQTVAGTSGKTYQGLGWHSGGGYMTKHEAANIVNLPSFANNTDITSFDELRFFIGLSVIPATCFDGCTNLVSVKLPHTIKRLDNICFRGCVSLQRINIPHGCTDILASFRGCTSLKKIHVPASVRIQGLADTSGVEEVTIDENCSFISNGTLKDCKSLKKLVLRYGPSEINEQMCMGCTELRSVYIPRSVTKIDNKAFSGSGIEKVKIPGSVTDIGTNSFEKNNSLVKVLLQKGLKNIGNSAFISCLNLVEIEFPEGLETIGNQAFYTNIS